MKNALTRYTSMITLWMLVFNILIPFQVTRASSDEIVYPLKEISKLECRFEDFDKLTSNCKTSLPILKTADYNKYATQNGGYNDYTRLYTVLWGASYKYGWDVWNGWHQGTDIATARWTPVYSIADGTVIESGTAVGWGKYVSIEHTIRGQKIVSNYAHLSEITVNKGEKVDVSEKIWEVWSTGNSTGNHLHFQIDLPSKFHPYYYDWNTCPFSYFEIAEKWVCFDELTKNTFDPLEFLETSGAIVDDIVSSTSWQTKKIELSITQSSLTDVLSTTVYHGFGTSFDVKNVQELYKLLGYYTWDITWDYSDVEDSVIAYQIDTWVIASASDDGAGWFGPKTRTQTRKDYTAFLSNGWQVVSKTIEEETEEETTQTWNTQIQHKPVTTVSRVNLKTREEIERQEIDSFLNKYDIKFADTASQVELGAQKSTTLSVIDAKWRGYKWNTPWNVTFDYDTSVVKVFPESFYSFTDGTRDIKITGLKQWNTKVTMKIWNIEIKTFSVTVWQAWVKQTADQAKLFLQDTAILWNGNTGLILLKDQYGTNLIGSEFAGEIQLSSNKPVLYCIKKGRLQDIKEIYTRKCFDDEFTDTLSYSYSDTIEWILIFDYKVLSTWDMNLSLTKAGNEIAKRNITSSMPKDINSSYVYADEIKDTLLSWISSTNNQWNFNQQETISKADAIEWIFNAMWQLWIKNAEIYQEDLSFRQINRQEFLTLVSKYLKEQVVDTWGKQYRDGDENLSQSVAALLWNTYTWKDQFWDTYFQPDKEISRWEAAYLLVHALRAQSRWSVASN